jgi:GNAT superfamily N-acetyltransferase
MRIEYSKRASKTPAFALMAEGWNELVQEGFTPEGDGVSPVKPDNEVLFAVGDDADVVGVLAYALDAPANAYVVSLAYVEPSSRKRGVFKALIAQLQKLAREDRVDRIELQAAVENAPFQAVLRHLNRPVVSVVYELATA